MKKHLFAQNLNKIFSQYAKNEYVPSLAFNAKEKQRKRKF